MHIHQKFIQLSFIAILGLLGCSNEKKLSTQYSNGEVFIYNYKGPSVAPQYRRDYTIRVRPGMINFTIDSYDQVLYSDSSDLSVNAYDSFVRSIAELHITSKEPKRGSMCTGGVSDNLILYAGSNKELKGFVYYCAGTKDGNLEGDVAAAADLFKALVPDLSKKIEATKKN